MFVRREYTLARNVLRGCGCDFYGQTVLENGVATRIVNLHRFEPLAWTRK
jgi:hypothetical protein